MSRESANPAAAATDGRHRRSDRSRQRIVDALLALIKEGYSQPSAADVAERAGVGLRTVFRHFDDMNTLHMAMINTMQQRLLPRAMAPLEGPTIAARLRALAARRQSIFEDILTIRAVASARRFQSPLLMENHTYFTSLEIRGVEDALGATHKLRPARQLAIESLLSFDTWRRLRVDRERSVVDAKAVIDLALGALIADYDVNTEGSA